jgi:hypothetical protein
VTDGTGLAHTRVGDTERQACDDRLKEAVGTGLLTLHEYEQRVGSVWRAQTRGELADLVGDLPQRAGADVAPRWSARKRGVVIASAAVAAVAAASVSGAVFAFGGSHGNVGDRLVFVPPGVTEFEVPSGVGDVTVVVPDGYRAVPVKNGVGDVDCRLACSRPEPKTVRVTSGGVGDLIVLTQQEQQATEAR